MGLSGEAVVSSVANPRHPNSNTQAEQRPSGESEVNSAPHFPHRGWSAIVGLSITEPQNRTARKLVQSYEKTPDSRSKDGPHSPRLQHFSAAHPRSAAIKCCSSASTSPG